EFDRLTQCKQKPSRGSKGEKGGNSGEWKLTMGTMGFLSGEAQFFITNSPVYLKALSNPTKNFQYSYRDTKDTNPNYNFRVSHFTLVSFNVLLCSQSSKGKCF
ncbi:hypothetical protein PanWU01x14_186010, partial [Parasponia andersonii]